MQQAGKVSERASDALASVVAIYNLVSCYCTSTRMWLGKGGWGRWVTSKSQQQARCRHGCGVDEQNTLGAAPDCRMLVLPTPPLARVVTAAFPLAWPRPAPNAALLDFKGCALVSQPPPSTHLVQRCFKLS
jgi:hypothetical protein